MDERDTQNAQGSSDATRKAEIPVGSRLTVCGVEFEKVSIFKWLVRGSAPDLLDATDAMIRLLVSGGAVLKEVKE